MQTIAAGFGFFLMMLFNACMATEIIGSIVPPFPEGWKDEGGACISNTLGSERICDYSIGILRKDGELVLYFGKSAPRIEPEKARWHVIDRMPYPKISKTQQVVLGNCERDGKHDGAIIAIVKRTDTEWYSIVQNAYKANFITGRFEKISAKGIRCINEGWGV
jgi:hypothetical protein